MTGLDGEILEPDHRAGDDTSGADETSVRAGFWRTFAKAAGQIPFAEDLVASYYCALDPATPNRTRAVLLAALAYFILPTDFVPDFIAGFGFSDDATVLLAALAAVRGNMRDVHYEAARRALSDPDSQKDDA